MNKLQIVHAVIEMDKNFSITEILDLIEGKANVCDLADIHKMLSDHMSGNEPNAARIARLVIEGMPVSR